MLVEDLHSDVRLAWRSLRRARSFSAAAIVTLALGIAGTTVMFTLLQGVLLRPLPVREQHRLVVAWKELRSTGIARYAFDAAGVDAVRDSSRLVERVAGAGRGVWREVITEDGQSGYVDAGVVTGAFFEVLGVEPVLGRAIVPADDVDGAGNVVVLGRGYWMRHYGGSPTVIGRTIALDQNRFTIVGVVPDVGYPGAIDVWRTTRSFSIDGPFGDAARREIDLIARLRPGVTLAHVTSELTAVTRRSDSSAPAGTLRGLTPVVVPFTDAVVGGVRTALIALMAAVGLVLLIASANVANLTLMRGEDRKAELAIREALGAGRGRIVSQLVAESLVLTLAAAAIGLLVTWWTLRALLALVPDGLPRIESVRIDATVVLFTLLVALAATVLAGLAPAVSLARADLIAPLRAGGRTAAGPAGRRGRRALVIAQVALAVTIVAGAGLLVRSVRNLQAVDLGMPADRLVFAALSLPGAKYPTQARHAQFLDAAIAQLEAAPAIAAATPVNLAPFSGEGWDVPRFTAEGQSADRAAANPPLNLESIFPNYFTTLGIPLVRGRPFTAADRAGALAVAIVSDDLAAWTWPGQDPIGKRLKEGGPASREHWLTVVGVAAPSRYREIARPRPTIYLPAAQFLVTAEMFVLRTAGPVAAVASIVRDRIRTVDPDVLVMQVAPFARLLDAPLGRPRFNAFLLSMFAGAALLLSAIGLYAVMGAFVRARDRELALRLALGATAGTLRRLVLGEALSLAGAGAAIGLAGAIAATRLMRGLLFEIDALDPTTLLGAALLLVAAAAFAAFVPMRRAVRLDAAAVLRN